MFAPVLGWEGVGGNHRVVPSLMGEVVPPLFLLLGTPPLLFIQYSP